MNSDIRLLVADPDGDVRSKIRELFVSQGYTVDEAADGIAVLKFFRRNDYSLIVMDTDLPELDGRNVCRQLRKTSDVPILFISERKSEQEKLCAFEIGADDFIVKPFYPREVLARVKVFLYRTGSRANNTPSKIAFNGLFINTLSREVTVDDRPVSLTPKEYDLLFFLSQNPNKAYSREALLNEVWGYCFTGSDRTIDTHIRSLRDNIRPYDGYIVTVWGFGYKFVI
ncbi:MAG: response regulator transcription factor [Clostridiales bacterium]|nr:response regulator transcription factor [Clostridiales bacterium]